MTENNDIADIKIEQPTDEPKGEVKTPDSDEQPLPAETVEMEAFAEDEKPYRPAEQVDITEPSLDAELPAAEPAVDTEAADVEIEDDDEPEVIEGEFDTSMESVVEAVLFASDEPLSAAKLMEITDSSSIKTIRKAVKALNRKYRLGKTSFRIEEIAGGYQMMTLSVFNPWLSKLIRVRSDNKLSPAQLETLAIVAYKQPIIRADVEAIRGVATGEILRNLMYKGMVKIVGRAEVLGRPMQYGTTKKFLDIFGLANLKDLPKVEELKNPEKGT